MRPWIAACVVAAYVTSLLLTETAHARPCKHPPPRDRPAHGRPLGVTLTAFGDSLTDNGSNQWPRSNYLIPDPKAYDKGRSSNGPVWVEHMRKLSGGKVSQVFNYAYAGAFACNELEYFGSYYTAATAPLSLGNQTDMYLAARSTLKKGSRNVAVVWAGTNDINTVIAASNQTAAGTLLVTCVLNNVAKLALSGETDVVVFSLPPLDASPFALGAFSAPVRALIKFAIAQLNQGLRLGVLGLQAQLPQTRLHFYDAETFIRGAIAAAPLAGVNTTVPCVVGVPAGRSPFFGAVDPNVTTVICARSKDFYFWDWLHPTTDSHAQLAADVSRAFKGWGLY